MHRNPSKLRKEVKHTTLAMEPNQKPAGFVCNYSRCTNGPGEELIQFPGSTYTYCFSHTNPWDGTAVMALIREEARAFRPPEPVPKKPNRPRPRKLQIPGSIYQSPSPVINIIVGADVKGVKETTFPLPANILKHHSGFFRRELRPKSKGKTRTTFYFRNEYPAVFGYLKEYLFRGIVSDASPTGVIPPIPPDPKTKSEQPLPRPSLSHFVNLWILAGTLEIPSLADYAAYRCLLRLDAGYKIGEGNLTHNFNKSERRSLPRKFLVDYVVSRGNNLSWDGWSRELLQEVGEAQMKRMNRRKMDPLMDVTNYYRDGKEGVERDEG